MACYQQLIKLVISLTLTRNQLDGGFMQHCGGGDVKFRQSKDLFWANICTRATSSVHWMNDVTMVDDTAPDQIPWTSNQKCKLWGYSIRMVESRNYQRDHFTCTFCTECLTWELQPFPRKDTKYCEPRKNDTKLISKTESLLGHGPVPVSFNAHYFQLRSGVCLWLCTGTNPKLWTRTSVVAAKVSDYCPCPFKSPVTVTPCFTAVSAYCSVMSLQVRSRYLMLVKALHTVVSYSWIFNNQLRLVLTQILSGQQGHRTGESPLGPPVDRVI